MSFEPPIRRVVVEAFRGFRDRQEFDVAASAVVLAGPNGTGKTSFFDALQWCLLGRIERLESLRARRNVEHIVNQYRLSERAVVEVELSIRGRSFTVRRTGDHSSSTLEFREAGAVPLFGPDAETALERALVPGDGLTLNTALTTSGLMQQDVMRAVLEAKPADRYRHISTVLGLGALEDFEEAARELAREAKAQADAARADRDSAAASLAETQASVVVAQQRLQSLPRVDTLLADIVALLRRAPGSIVVDPDFRLTEPGDIRELFAATSELIEELDAFSASWDTAQTVRVSLSPQPTDESVESAAATLEAAAAAVDEARADSAAAQAGLEVAQAAAQDLARLAALAIPLLTERCPVCLQAIDAAHVEQELRDRATETETMLSLQSATDDAQRELRAAEARLADAHAAVSALEALRARWAVYRASADRALQASESVLVRTGSLRVSAADTDDLVQLLHEVLEFLRSTRRRSLEVLDTLEEGVDRGYLDRAQSEVATFAEVLASRTQRLEEASQRAHLLKTLADAAVDARVEVTERRFKAVQPLVADIFSRLDPHPAFKTIEFELDTYYRRGTTSPLVRDLVEGVTADPLVVFSTSQANIAALSYFLAMGLSAGDRTLPFVLLDDPVQSMDDVNVLGFADLCRHLRTGRQLIVSTHERRFARLLERKLAPRSESYTTRVLEFVGWDRSGPAVEVRTVESQLVDDPIRVVQAAS